MKSVVLSRAISTSVWCTHPGSTNHPPALYRWTPPVPLAAPAGRSAPTGCIAACGLCGDTVALLWNFSNTLDWNRQKVVITHDPCRMA